MIVKKRTSTQSVVTTSCWLANVSENWIASAIQQMSATNAATALAIKSPEYAPLRSRQANPVAELGQRFDLPYRQVRLLARRYASDRMGDAERSRSVDGHPGERLLGPETEQGASHVHRQCRREHGRSARVRVRRNRHRNLVLSQQVDGWLSFLLQRVKRPRQEHCDGATSRCSR